MPETARSTLTPKEVAGVNDFSNDSKGVIVLLNEPYQESFFRTFRLIETEAKGRPMTWNKAQPGFQRFPKFPTLTSWQR